MYSKHPSDLQRKKKNRNAYAKPLAILGASLLCTLVVSIPAQSVEAFWLFSTTQAASGNEPPVLHDSTISLLEAATNPDPNPIKGGLEVAISSGSALLANAGPSGVLPLSSLSVETQSEQISLYVVREGDSLSTIGEMFNVSVNTILWANDLKSAKDIHPGDSLLILPVSGLQYKVAKGDTLASIAKKYSADADEIASFNGLEVGGALAAGTEIIIPGGDFTPEKPAAKSTTGSGSVSKALPALTGYFGNPVPGARLSQGVHGHNGVDLAAPNGTPAYASAAGVVIVAKNNGGYNGGYGNYVAIKHDNGTQTLYAHLSSVAVSVGAAVEKGQRIGGVGNTGRSTGNHLHFEVWGAKNPFSN